MWVYVSVDVDANLIRPTTFMSLVSKKNYERERVRKGPLIRRVHVV